MKTAKKYVSADLLIAPLADTQFEVTTSSACSESRVLSSSRSRFFTSHLCSSNLPWRTLFHHHLAHRGAFRWHFAN